MSKQHVIKVKNFTKAAPPLRRYFEEIYRDPRHANLSRFQWDIWYVPNQYRHHRALAKNFFPRALYKQLCNDLVEYGQTQLGCHSISEPWVSLYLDDCEQRLHTDSPHGPWAYVLSLSPSSCSFTGGETLILKPEILNYWQNFARHTGRELKDIFHVVEPKMNQLVVFDPRLPHGVERVRNAIDPREGRLVIHGWFVNPEPYVTGGLHGLGRARLSAAVNKNLKNVFAEVEIPESLMGILTLRLRVSPSGATTRADIQTNTLVGESLIQNQILREISRASWPRSRKASEIILPLIFD